MAATNGADTIDDRRPYRTVPVLAQLYEADLYDRPTTYRWWLAAGFGGIIEANLQMFAVIASAPVMTIIIDPSDEIGTEVWRHFEYRGDPLPTRWNHPDAGPHGPVIVAPCLEPFARRVLHAVAPVFEQHLAPALPMGRSWVVAVAAGGVTAFDAPVSPVAGEFDEFQHPLRVVFDFQDVEMGTR